MFHLTFASRNALSHLNCAEKVSTLTVGQNTRILNHETIDERKRYRIDNLQVRVTSKNY
jgi:hypothetical protein